MYIPKFKTTIRENKKAIWVKMPNGDDHNLGDLRNVTPEIASIISFAFIKGMHAAKYLYAKVDIPHQYTTCTFELHEEKIKGEDHE